MGECLVLMDHHLRGSTVVQKLAVFGSDRAPDFGMDS